MNDELGPEGSDDAPLSLSEAANAYAATDAAEEPKGQPEADYDPDVDDEATEDADALPEEDSEDDTEEGETDDEEGQADEDSDDEPESDQGRYVAKNGKVKLEDGSTVTVDELIKDNLRDRDYRQKTMEAAEIRKSFEAKSSAVKQQEQELEHAAWSQVVRQP